MKLRPRLNLMTGTINPVPLVTVILLLLFFFLLGSSFVTLPGIIVELPKSPFGISVPLSNLIVSVFLEPEKKDTSTGFSAKREVLFYVNDQELNFEDLKKMIPEFASQHPNQMVIIKADKEVPQAYIIELTNLFLAQNLSVLLATQPDAEH
ncbi:biopolymer transporter ExbD [Candidatus Methylacidiphilum fumarolicum]|nr:biopolymer transporter ExbD [Candidatus Methylacidiphilum fumarolicum]MBW6414115.1 biopolymer transporter ExbD [Candidatus Methylacidiphilum fumarolicum]TFE75200.1 biopolymer transporter ExbD [Candidatus Methylacidiphilum fumarolicum]TFE76189.1 biopolymer transporter ExbD [Candidatus Methylacidiphilum fumarolicum]